MNIESKYLSSLTFTSRKICASKSGISVGKTSAFGKTLEVHSQKNKKVSFFYKPQHTDPLYLLSNSLWKINLKPRRERDDAFERKRTKSKDQQSRLDADVITLQRRHRGGWPLSALLFFFLFCLILSISSSFSYLCLKSMTAYGSTVPPSFNAILEKISVPSERIPLPQFVDILLEVERIVSSGKYDASEDLTFFVNVILNHASFALSAISSARVDGEHLDDVKLRFFDTLLAFSAMALHGSCSHLEKNGILCCDPHQLYDILGNIFQFLCSEKCIVFDETSNDVESTYSKLFLGKIMDLCHLSVCDGPKNIILMGITWKAFKIVITKMGPKLNSVDSEKFLMEWSLIFEVLFTETQKVTAKSIESILKFFRFCIAILIAIIQSSKEKIRYQKQGGLEKASFLLLEIRAALSSQTIWSSEYSSRIISQIESPLDSLFVQILSIVRDDEKRAFVGFWMAKGDSTSFPSNLDPSKNFLYYSKLHFFLLMFRHGSRSFSPDFFDLLESCLKFIFESPLHCLSSFIESELLLFDRVCQTILISISQLQERQFFGFARHLLEIISRFIFHPHYLCRELAKNIWFQFVLNGDELVLANTRKFLVAFLDRNFSTKSNLVRQIACHFCKPLISQCFSFDRHPFPLKLIFPLSENSLMFLCNMISFLPHTSITISSTLPKGFSAFGRFC